MKASTNSDNDLPTTSKEYLKAAKQWFIKTPERALNQAYQAALNIKSIEDEYVRGGNIWTESANDGKDSEYLMSVVRADIEKEVMIAKLRLAEFKASCLVLSIPVSAYLDKLGFLDEVLTKYVAKSNTSATFPSVLPSGRIDSDSSQVKSQLVSVTVDAVDVQTTCDRTNSLSNSLGEKIENVKQELDPKVKAEVVQSLQNSRNKASTVITGTAIKYAVLLVLLPLMYQQLSKHFLQPASTATLQQELVHRNQKSK